MHHLGRALRDVHGRDGLVRVTRLVYAASMEQLATKIDQIMVPSAEIAITGGVLADEAMKLFR